MALFQDTSEQQKTLHLKKAAQIYNMAFSAAQHWKRYTIEHPGYSILCLAILNNLLSIQTDTNHNAEKVAKLVICLRNSLSEAKSTIAEEERSFFAKNLDQLCNDDRNTFNGYVPVTGTTTVNNESSTSSKLVGA